MSEAAGVDLAWTEWRLSRGESAPIARAAAKAAWTHVSRDIVAATQQIVRGALHPSEFAASLFKARRFAAFAWDDPLPAIADLPVLLARMIKRRLSRGAGDHLTDLEAGKHDSPRRLYPTYRRAWPPVL
jgi:predicted ATP-grasp superfamily ATP-dependent carboligase